MIKTRLRLARTASKLTQEELALKLNVTKGTISKYEHGHINPSNEMLVLLAKTLNTTTDFLLGASDIFCLVDPFINNPEINEWYKLLPFENERDLKKLIEIWKIIKSEEN